MPAYESLSDRELVDQAQRDPEAFAVLYRRHVTAIRAFIVRRSGNRQLADDLTAAVFERAWIHLPRIEVPDHGIAPWLYRVAANEVASSFRKSGRGQRAQERLEHLGRAESSNPADEVIARADIEAVRVALGTLTPRHQEVISLRYLAGLSPQETAEVMGIAPPAVAAVLHRALKSLDRALRNTGFVPGDDADAPNEPDRGVVEANERGAPPGDEPNSTLTRPDNTQHHDQPNDQHERR